MLRNVALIVLDSARKDVFDDRASTLREMAAVSIEQCRAASNWSPPSHGAMLTGDLPHRNGIHSHDPSYEDVALEDTFLGAFREYERIGVSGNLFAGRPYGFDGLFDSFESISRHALFPEGTEIDTFLHEIDAEGIHRYLEFLRRTLDHDATLKSFANGAALKFNEYARGTPVPRLWDFGTRAALGHVRSELSAVEDRPFFLFANLMETHNPHANNVFYGADDVPNAWSSGEWNTYKFNNLAPEERPEGYVEHYRSLHAESIAYVDRQIAAFVEWVRANVPGETTFVVTADHGENLCYESDGDVLGHFGNMSESLLHVPFLVIDPPADRNVTGEGYFSHLDLGAVLAGLRDDELSVPFRDVAPAEVVGSAPPEGINNYEYWDRMIRCVYDGTAKYVWDSHGERAKYEVDHDPPYGAREIDDDADVPDAARDQFEADVREFKSQFTDKATKEWGDDAPTERLKQLGYL